MLHDFIQSIAGMAPEGTFLSQPFVVQGFLAVILVSLICGAVGSLVVGNRMAFFSDALAHCAFAGVALGLLSGLLMSAERESNFYRLGIPLVMVGFGAVVGLAIAYVREQTGLASDTVIGVFFAGAIGFGAVLSKSLSQYGNFNVENFIFGNPVTVGEDDILLLFGLAVVTAVVMLTLHNHLVFASFNPSLARSRGIALRMGNYVFILLLALIVNLSLKAVGALLINAMLIVPAATAANLCRNMRQMFWTTIGLSLGVGLVGNWLSCDVAIPLGDHGALLTFGSGGLIVVLSVMLFFLSMAVGPWLRGQRAG